MLAPQEKKKKQLKEMSKTCTCQVRNEDLLQGNVFKFVVQVK